MSLQRVGALLEALEELEHAYEDHLERHQRREYVRKEHVPFLGMRFRTFDEYLAVSNPRNFSHYVRVSPSEFQELYERLAPKLIHPKNHVSPITGRERLFIFLRYVGHGSNFGAVAEETHCGKSTISSIVYEVADAITDVLFEEAFPPITQTHLEEVALKTQERYDYPRAVGFLDGKHIRIQKPAHSGSLYFNYKKTFSIILLALVDCDYRIMAFDLGAPGRVGDAGVYMNSTMRHFFDARDDIFPPTRELGDVGAVQYHILVDCGFGQGYRYIRPYSQASADTASKRRFNAKHSGARRMVESTFGILCQRFPRLSNTMLLAPDGAIKVVTALLLSRLFHVLHNLLPRRQNALEDVVRYPARNEQLVPLAEPVMEEGAQAGATARERMRAYYDALYGPPR